jgi:hypothetical protein
VVFAATLALAAVLAELILASEMMLLEQPPSPVLALALRATVPTLLVLLVGVVPLIELQSVLAARGWRFARDGKGRVPRTAWGLLLLVFAGWLVVFFWGVGRAVPQVSHSYSATSSSSSTTRTWGLGGGSGSAEKDLSTWAGKAAAGQIPGTGFDSTGVAIGRVGLGGGKFNGGGGGGGLTRACLERIGVIGISLMGLLSGFASVSSPWHTFVDDRAYGKRPITDADIARKQAGLDATSELLLTKRHRLRSLQRKAQAVAEGIGGGQTHGTAAGASGGLVGKVIGSLRSMAGTGEAAEIKALQVEISGLETMESNLAASLSLLKSRQAAHAKDGTALGRLFAIPRYAFACYCVYRVLATTLTTFRRTYYSSASFSSSDPISRFLGLLAKHWDPKLDQLAWARQISFLLSGVILAASANSVLQTFRLFAKWAPGLLHQAQANLALLIGQITATYVISAALLLRNSLPREVGRSVGDALESALEPVFVDRWFEGWFLLASAATAAGIWIGRKLSGGFGGDWGEWDEFGGEELGQKRS